MPRRKRRDDDVPVGDLVVRGTSIIEPRSGCYIAYAFPTELNAMVAAREMNEIADWTGIIKIRASGRDPNCKSEVERIAALHGGRIGEGGGEISAKACAKAVETLKL